MQRIFDFLKDPHTFYYATCDGDKPRVRPFGFCMEFEGKFYIGMGKHKDSYKQTLANPNIEICSTDSHRRWLRVRGVAVPDDRPEVLEAAFKVSPGLKSMYNEKTGQQLGHFYITEGEAEICSNKDGFIKFNF